jgi:hypothetical protein
VESTQIAPIDVFAGLVQTGLVLGSWIVFSFALHVIGKKLHHSAPWLAWIPILNLGYLMTLARRSPWMALVFLVPIVGFIFYAMVFGEIAERLQMPNWLGWCMILPIANYFIVTYLAVSGTGPTRSRPRGSDAAVFDRAGARVS